MKSKKKHSLDWKLYVITDKDAAAGRSLAEIVKKAILGGAGVIQLRDKKAGDRELCRQAEELLKITRAAGVPLIINDRLSVASAIGADGAHLGQDDEGIVVARQLLGKDAILGRSTHSPKQALKAQKEGFDYIGVGPVFSTPTKPTYDPVGLELIRFAVKNIKIPFVAIGGINEDNVSKVREAGARTVAVVRAVMASGDPQKTAENLCKIMA